MAVTEGFLRTPHSPLQLKLSLRKPETLLKYLFGSVPSDNLKAAVMVIQTNATTPDLECGPYSIRHSSDGSSATVQRMLADIRELAPVVTGRVAQFDAERRMPIGCSASAS
jgi:hypothetical protein